MAIRERLYELSGSELKVWLTYLLHANREMLAWPGRELIAKETGLYTDTISAARAALVAKGWLQDAGRLQDAEGRWAGGKRFRVMIPSIAGKTPTLEKTGYRQRPSAGKIRHHKGGFHSSITGKTPARSRTKEVEPKKKRRRSSSFEPSRFSFSGLHIKVTEKQDQLLGEAFPWVDRPGEYRKMDAWLEANPDRRPKKHSRFAYNWFSRIESPRGRGDRKRSSGALAPPPGKYDNLKPDAMV